MWKGIVLFNPSQYETRGTHTGKYFVVVLTRKIRNVNEGSTFITSEIQFNEVVLNLTSDES